MIFDLGPYLGDGPGPYPVLRHILASHPPGYAVEFGVEKAVSLKLIAAHMPVVGFDSFEGLPEQWRPEYPKGALKVRPPDPVPNATIVAGWFDDTLPTFDFAALEPIGLIHFDADLYSSTATALKHVGPHITSGTICVFDEYHGYPQAELHEQRAWWDHVVRHHLEWDVIGHAEQTWAIRVR